jgi:hypothetical protein
LLAISSHYLLSLCLKSQAILHRDKAGWHASSNQGSRRQILCRKAKWNWTRKPKSTEMRAEPKWQKKADSELENYFKPTTVYIKS